jgi:hypothetical protein
MRETNKGNPLLSRLKAFACGGLIAGVAAHVATALLISLGSIRPFKGPSDSPESSKRATQTNVLVHGLNILINEMTQ